uniref:SG1B-like salivary protein n=1 Tax=Anopheles cracens TaxID=123217 RepID=Q7YT45_9DIPT|nr:SG1B-like salivary protein [Anopheles cracens]
MEKVRMGVLLLVLLATLAGARPQETDPFVDEPDQCLIGVSAQVLAALSESLRTELKCEDLWSSVLLRYHHTRTNLTECLARASGDATPAPASSFCQLLLDDVERQLDQEHRQSLADIEQKLHVTQQEARAHHDEKTALEGQLHRLQDDRDTLYLELLLANIAIGDAQQAKKYYELYPGKDPADRLHAQIVRSVYRVAKYQDQRLLNLVQFVRTLAGTEPKLGLYRLMREEILKRPSQRDTYVAAIFALSLGADGDVRARDPRLYTDTMGPIEQRWRDQLYNGQFNEVADFARRFATQFAQMQKPLAYPNALPLPQQRLEAFRHILDQIRQHNPNNAHSYLVQTAKQFDICETFIKKSKVDAAVTQTLEQLRKRFAEFSRKEYGVYLREAKG